MILAFQSLKKYFPALNKKVIGKEQIIKVLDFLDIGLFEIPMDGRGAYVKVWDDKSEYVFIKYNLQSILYHETLAYETVHACLHEPAATFLFDRHNKEAEVLSLVMMMPETDLARLNRIKHQLEPESYELLERRNQARRDWSCLR